MQTDLKARKELFKPINSTRNFEEVAAQIKGLILSGELKADDILPSEREMAASFQASRNTIREAYRILEGNGFIELKTGAKGGARVCQLDGQKVTQSLVDLIDIGNISLSDICQARITIELSAVEEAMRRATDDDFLFLERRIEKDLQTISESPGNQHNGQPSRYYEFHTLLAKTAKNKIYQYLVNSMVEISIRFLVKHTRNRGGQRDHILEHKAILEAFKSGDKELTKRLLKKHLLTAESSIFKTMIKSSTGQ